MKVHLLIVDDESEIRDMLERHFRFIGFEVTQASNGAEAVRVLENKKIDIVISDIMMPVMTGIELLRTIHCDFPMVHAIMITGYVTLDNALACMRLGADTLIFKPLADLSELEDAVQKAVESIQHWVHLLKQLQSMRPDDA